MRTNALLGAIALVVLLQTAGCGGDYLSPAASQALATIKVGTSRDDVVRQLGPPHSQEMVGKTELLTYRPDWTAQNTAAGFSPIAIVDGKVAGVGPNFAYKVKADFADATARK